MPRRESVSTSSGRRRYTVPGSNGGRFDAAASSEIAQTVVGQLASTPPGLAGLSRTFRQTIYVRSGQVD